MQSPHYRGRTGVQTGEVTPPNSHSSSGLDLELKVRPSKCGSLPAADGTWPFGDTDLTGMGKGKAHGVSVPSSKGLQSGGRGWKPRGGPARGRGGVPGCTWVT